MRIQITSTSKIVQFNGIPARVWEGETESGIGVICFVTRLAVKDELADCTEFERDLEQCDPPSAEAQGFPTRMVL